MNKFITIILILAIAAPMLIRNVIIMEFFIQREAIAKELCHEREIEHSCCKGSCVLKDRLDDLHTKEEKSSVPFKNFKEALYDLSHRMVHTIHPIASATPELLLSFDKTSKAFTDPIGKPPASLYSDLF